MNNQLTKEFSINKENNTIIVKREFAAKLSMIWDAFTKSDILDLWWAPEPWKTKTKSMDFREGGRWLYAMVGPKGEEHWSFADYLKIQDQENYTALEGFADSEGNANAELPQSNWKIDFSKQENKSLVVICITYKDLAQMETTIQMGFKEGFTMGLNQLDKLLESYSQN